MTTAAPPAPLKTPVTDAPDYTEASNRRRRIIPLVILLIISLVLTAITRGLVYDRRESLQTTQRSDKRLSGVDTFALGLILGGLRGPLIMFLWPSIENQKIERNLEDIDTKINLVRMLQPEFDSVHLFQIWNKAYNISVQMASIPNKYATILSALHYAAQVNEERPDNVNIISAYGDVYFNKLGNSAEKKHFIRRVRTESMHGTDPRAREAARQRRDHNLQRTRHEVLLDEKGFLLPQFLQPRWERGGTVPQKLRDAGYTGAPLQYLAHYNTPEMGGFPYGVSPAALGYNYFMRAAVLSRITGQKHIHVGDTIIDSRPAVTLKFWAEEEWERARRLEISLAGLPQPEDRIDKWLLDPPTASLAPDAKFAMTGEPAEAAVKEALFSLKRMVQVGQEALKEYQRHLDAYKFSDFAPNAGNFPAHIDALRALMSESEGDRAYLALLAANNGILPQDEARRSELVQTAIRKYTEARDQNYLVILRYYVDDELAKATYPQMALKPGEQHTRRTIHELDPSRYPEVFQATRKYIAEKRPGTQTGDDVVEHMTYISRIDQRLEHLRALK